MEPGLQWGVNGGSCLVPWFERSDTCPTCRRIVKGTHDNHATASLIETLLNIFPDRKRDADELKELELIYRPGQKVNSHSSLLNSTILTSQINITNTYSDEDEQEQDEDEEEDDGITWTPCPCCVSPNPHNFICPDPIPFPDPVRGPVRSDVYSYRSHLRCQVCPNVFPTAWKTGWKCENCANVNCGNLFQCSVEGALQPVKDQAAKLADTYMEGLVTSYFAGLVVPAHYINTTELALFSAWKVTNNVTWRDIGVRICDFLLAKNGNMIPFSPKQLRPEDFTCYLCMLPVLKCNFVSWWIHERESTGYVDNRVKCWYGRGCRTQVHNPEHAARLVHACDETPAGRRRNDAPPRGGGVVVGVGALGDGAFGGGVMAAAVAEVGAMGGYGGVEADDGGNGGGGDGDAGGGAAGGAGGGGE